MGRWVGTKAGLKDCSKNVQQVKKYKYLSVSMVLQEMRIKTCKEKFREVEKVEAADCYTQWPCLINFDRLIMDNYELDKTGYKPFKDIYIYIFLPTPLFSPCQGRQPTS